MAVAVALIAGSLGAQAALYDRGGGMIYDSTLNITWLADMNYALTSGHTGTGVEANGNMSWDAATAWANNLVYGGFSDWRLPTLNPKDTTCSNNLDAGGSFGLQYFGTNCTGGELSHLFVFDLGNEAGTPVLNQSGDTDEQIANLALFSSVQSYYYWSGTGYAPNADSVWNFTTVNGSQIHLGKFAGSSAVALSAVAVRSGDILAVPEPATLALTATALLGLAASRRRRPAVTMA